MYLACRPHGQSWSSFGVVCCCQCVVGLPSSATSGCCCTCLVDMRSYTCPALDFIMIVTSYLYSVVVFLSCRMGCESRCEVSLLPSNCCNVPLAIVASSKCDTTLCFTVSQPVSLTVCFIRRANRVNMTLYMLLFFEFFLSMVVSEQYSPHNL